MNSITHPKKREHTTSSTGRTYLGLHDEKCQDSTRKLWYHIQCWYHQRPCWGASCVLLASLLILWSPLYLLQTTTVPANTLWPGLLVGGLLFVMGLVELLAPSQALTAGAAGIVLSLLSLITALGGFGIGMFLGVIGSSCVVAWKPAKKTMSRHLVFWSVFGCSLVMMLCLMALVTNGELAIAAPIAPMIGPFTVFTSKAECHNIRSITTISRVDHRTPVNLSFSESCILHHVVITKHVLGGTIRITQGTSIQRGVTIETVASHSDVSQIQNVSLISSPGSLTQVIAVDIETNATSQQLFANLESATNYDVSLSFS
jgi:hypothetical protein